MKKKFLCILSFLMIAMFAVTCMGMSIGAEEFDIPEFTAEDLGEALPEEEVEPHAGEVTEEEEAAFALYNADDELVGKYADTVDEEGYVNLAIDQAANAVEDGYTLKLLKNYSFAKYGTEANKTSVDFKSVNFTFDGQGYTITDTFNRQTYKTEYPDDNEHDDCSSMIFKSDVTIINIKFDTDATSVAQAHTYGFITIRDGKTLTLEGVEFIDCWGTNGASVWVLGASKLVAEGVRITGGGGSGAGVLAVHAGSAEISDLTATNVSNTVFGVSHHKNGGTGYIENANITGCDTAFVVGNKGTLSFGTNVSASGNTTGMQVNAGGVAKISNNLTIEGNTSNVVLAGEDLLEIDSSFTGSIGVSMSSGLKLGHMAEGTESFEGKIFKGTDANTSYTTYGALKGTGKMAGTDHSLMNAFTLEDAYDDSDMVIPYKYYLKTGNETDGYVRTPYDTFDKAYSKISSGGTGTIYLIDDITVSTDIKSSHQDLNNNKVITINGNGHTLTIDSAYTENYLFAIYEEAEAYFENLVIDGNQNQLAYIANNNGGGATGATNCLFYNGYRSGASGAFHSEVTTEGNKSAITVIDTKFVDCSGPNGVLWTHTMGDVTVDNAEFINCSGNNGIIQLASKSKLYLDEITLQNCTSATVYEPAENQIVFGAGFNGEITISGGDRLWVGTLAEGVSELGGTVKLYGKDYTAAKYASFIKTATAGITVDNVTYSFKDKTNFSKDELPDNAVFMGWPMYKRTGTAESGYTRTPLPFIAQGSLCTSSWDNAVLYLLKDAEFGYEEDGFKLNGITTSAHFNAGGGKATTINGNGHKISRADGGANSIVLYGKSVLTLENVIYDGNDTSTLGYTNATNGGGTFKFKNCILTNGHTDGVVYSQNSTSASASHNFYFDNTIVASTRGITAHYYATINVNDSEFINHKATYLGVAINMPSSTDTEAAKVTLNLTGTNLFKNIHSTNQASAAIYVNGAIVNISGDLTITECSVPSGFGGGAMYLQPGSKLNLEGKINISGNKSGTAENNIYLSSYDMVTVTGNIEDGSVIGISITQTGKAFAKAASAGITGIEAFSADRAAVRVYGGYYKDTIGDGMLNGTPVIDTTVLEERLAAGDNLAIVLHWPWLVKDTSGNLKGYVSLYTAFGGDTTGEHNGSVTGNSGTIYAQKDITIDYRQGQGGIVAGENKDKDAILKYITETEFPLWTESGSFNHIDMTAATGLKLDGNGHIIAPNMISAGEVFVLYGGRSITLNNVIYNGDGMKTFASVPSIAKGTETITIENCYMGNGTAKPVFTVAYGGTFTVTDSTIDGYINLSGVDEIPDNIETPDENEYVAFKRSKMTILGNTTVKGKSGINISNAFADVYIGGSYTGEIEVTGDAERILAGDGFDGTLDSARSITKAGTDGATFAYYDGSKFAWTAKPELTLKTDSGVYSDGLGTVRFMSTFGTVNADAVTSYGTYVTVITSFNEESVPSEWNTAQFKEFTNTPGENKVYYVDVVEIPEDDFNTDINGVSFVNIKGIEKPLYYHFNTATVKRNDTIVNRAPKNLGETAYEA